MVQGFASQGFPLPPEKVQRLMTWQSRLGRYRIYDQMAAVEVADDMALREVQATLEATRREFYGASPRCLLILDPAATPSMVDDLRRRGYMPKVLS